MTKREGDDLPVSAPEEGTPTAEPASSPTPKRSRGSTTKDWTEDRRAKARAAGARGASNREAGKLLAQVRRSVAEGVGKGGAVLLPLSPLPGAYMVATADELADTVARLAERNPKLLESLAKTSVAMDYVALGSWVAGLLVAVGVQYGRVPLDSPMVAPFGIDELYDELARTWEHDGDEAQTNGHREDLAAASIVG